MFELETEHDGGAQGMRRLSASTLLISIILAAFALRLYRLDFFALRGDESFTVLFVQKPLAQMWNEIRMVEPNPPLLYLLLRGWVALAGSGEFATRFFSVFWGVLCVPLIYRLARSMSSPPQGEIVAQVSAFLLAINPYQIWHSQDVRNYTLWPALSLLAFVCFWKWRNIVSADAGARPPLRLIALFVTAELAALYTHYYETFILLAINIYMLGFFLRRRNRITWRAPALRQWVAAQLMLALVYLPYPLLISNRVALYGEGSGKQGVALWDIWQRTFATFTLGETIDASIRDLAWIPLALALIAIFFWRWRRERRGLFFLLYLGVPTVAVFALNLTRPLFLERYLNGISPGYYLLFAFGIGGLAARKAESSIRPGLSRSLLATLALAGLAVLSLLGLANYFYVPIYAKSPDWRGLAELVASQSRSGDVIVQNFPETSFVYYDRSRLPLVLYPKTFLPDASTARSLAELNSKYRRVWFIPAAPDYWDPGHYVETWLDRHDDLASETPVDTFRLRLYGTPSQFLTMMRPVDAAFGGMAQLIGFRIEPQDSQYHAVLYWSVHAATKKSYDVSLQLVAGDQVLAQVEQAPVKGSYPTKEWRKDEVVVDPYDLPLDRRADVLRVKMFDPLASVSLPVSDSAGRALGDAAVIPLFPGQ